MLFNNEFSWNHYYWMNCEGLSTNGSLILGILYECNQRRVKPTKTELANFLRISNATLNKQLKILKEKQLINDEWEVIYNGE